MSEGAMNFVPIRTDFWDRIAMNFGINIVLLGVFFLGIVGVVLVVAGATMRTAVARILTASLVLHLSTALLHDNTGIHSVGPIHYGDTGPTLTLIAVLGAARILDWLENHRWHGRSVCMLATYLAVSLPIFHIVHGAALNEQAENQYAPLEALESANLSNAVVLVPQAATYWHGHPERSSTGSWVYEFPPPDPYLRDDVLLLTRPIEVERLREHFPDRNIYRMYFPRLHGSITIVPLDSRSAAEGEP